MNNHARRILIESLPFDNRYDPNAPWEGSQGWPCRWIGLPEARPPFVAAYRLGFRLEEATGLRVHVSADERYELFLDGERIGRGPGIIRMNSSRRPGST